MPGGNGDPTGIALGGAVACVSVCFIFWSCQQSDKDKEIQKLKNIVAATQQYNQK